MTHTTFRQLHEACQQDARDIVAGREPATTDVVHSCEFKPDGAMARLIQKNVECRQLREVIRDLLPYAEAAIGSTWRQSPPADSVILAARKALEQQ